MTRHRPSFAVGLALFGTVLAGCSSTTVNGSPMPTPGSPQSSSAGSISSGSTTQATPGGDVPTVQSPLPAKVIDGSPCDTALTTADLSKFIGAPDPGKPGDTPLGPRCFWSNASGNGATTTVFYQTKSNGLSDAYQNVKPTAVHWEELEAVQGYPAVGYRAAGDVDTAGVDHCQVVVGISNSLAYSVGITLSELAKSKHVNPCTAGRNIADQVLTNIKARG